MIPDVILASLASNLGMFVASVVAAEMSKQRAVTEGVKKLKKNHGLVGAMIKKAEQKAALLDDEAVRYLLKRAKDHMYEVESIVDHSIIQNEKRKNNEVECELVYLRWPLCCHKDYSLSRYADAIKVLNEDFEDILKLPTETKTDGQIIWSDGDTSPDYIADIVGDSVKNDANHIIRLLNDPESDYRLIAIVGMVGIGKTTLARKIYQEVKAGTGKGEDFEIKLWIRFCNGLSSLIMWSDCRTEGPTKAQLLQLGTKIAKKKFLLVVDDAWSENVWETLLEVPLRQGDLERSRVIVTTRNKHVAKRIGASYIHHINKMNNNDAWKLLCQRASLSLNDEADLKDIGQQVVQKCDGLALAVRSMGRILRGKEPTRDDWENACRTAFQDISREEQYIINLSFRDLPSYMRQCFLYCSVFPEGFLIEKRYITQHWISEGFIVKKRNFTLEQIAEDCYDELIHRGLLQLEYGLDDMPRARMPIIIRSFAKDVSDYENFCTELVSATNLFEDRRLAIVKNNEASSQNDDEIENGGNNRTSNHRDNGGNAITEDITENDEASSRGRAFFWFFQLFIKELNNEDSRGSSSNEVRNDAKRGDRSMSRRLRSMKCLRTLILHKSTLPDDILVEDTFKRLTILRVLDLSGVKNIKVLPDTIGRLHHLRYLNISETDTRKVPGTIVYLSMLQYLLLINCKLIKTLPSGIERLRNLRSLDISGSGIIDIEWSFGKNEELTSIQGFPMANNGFFKKIKNGSHKQDGIFLNKLATLRIEKIENVKDPSFENELPIENCKLKELELSYSRRGNSLQEAKENPNKFKDVLDRFRPDKHLVSLKIENYRGEKYSSWISGSDLPNLQELHLQNCSLCEKLPSLGELPQLKFLAVTGFDKLTSLGAELRGNLNTNTAFPRLRRLHIGDMEVLHKWSDLKEQDLPNLKVVRLIGCVKLISIPDILQKSASLTRFEVDTRTMVEIEEILKRFTEGIVFNIENQGPQAGGQSQESLGTTTAAAAPFFQDDNICPPTTPTHTDEHTIIKGVNRFQYIKWKVLKDISRILTQFDFDRKKIAVIMLPVFALLILSVLFALFYS